MSPLISSVGGQGSPRAFGRRRGSRIPFVITPSITSPSSGSTQNRLYQLTVTSSAFDGINGANIHSSTDWQIASDSAFSNIVTQSLNDSTNKTSWTVNIASAGTYYYRVRHKANNGDVISEWSPGISAGNVVHYYYRVVIHAAGGTGGQGGWQPTKNGGSGGRGTATLETSVASVTAPGTLTYYVGNTGTNAISSGNAPGGSGYHRGGNGAYGSQDGPVYRSSSGGGGGSTAILYNGTILLGLGGGGGGSGSDSNGSGHGGAGGTLTGSSTAVSGNQGGYHDSNPGGSGGSGGGGGSQGGDVPNGGTNAVGGAGGAGFGGGSRGNGPSWNNGSGGGGGGSICYTLDGTIGDYRMYNTGGGDGSACKFTLFRAADGPTKTFSQVGSARNVSGNGSIAINSIPV